MIVLVASNKFRNSDKRIVIKIKLSGLYVKVLDWVLSDEYFFDRMRYLEFHRLEQLFQNNSTRLAVGEVVGEVVGAMLNKRITRILLMLSVTSGKAWKVKKAGQ